VWLSFVGSQSLQWLGRPFVGSFFRSPPHSNHSSSQRKKHNKQKLNLSSFLSQFNFVLQEIAKLEVKVKRDVPNQVPEYIKPEAEIFSIIRGQETPEKKYLFLFFCFHSNYSQ
jgi:hypothetical protein